MIQITPHMKVLVHVDPIDFRVGIDGLCRICRDAFKADPFDGTVFVFRGRLGTSVKLLIYDEPRILALPKTTFRGTVRVLALQPKRCEGKFAGAPTADTFDGGRSIFSAGLRQLASSIASRINSPAFVVDIPDNEIEIVRSQASRKIRANHPNLRSLMSTRPRFGRRWNVSQTRSTRKILSYFRS